MYKKHRIIIAVLFGVIFFLGYSFEVNYALIATEAITIISIALGVYIASFSQLASSELAKEMKSIPDKKIPTKTQLGVLAQYLKAALFFCILSIIISCICVLKIVTETSAVWEVMSSAALGILSINFVFICLLFEFMINRQLRE